jgi:2Fe-2S ferredoxin
MPKVTFKTARGEEIVVEDAVGTLMEAGKDNDVEGIDADCGGLCCCATCHVKVVPEWLEKTGPASEEEKGLLELEDSADERSRLSCQIELTEALDGIVVEVPER